MNKEDYADALRATASKYRNPKNQVFFRTDYCAICQLVNTECKICPLDIFQDRIGCIQHSFFKKLDDKIYERINHKGEYKYLKPTTLMLKRAEQLEKAAEAILEMSDEDFENKNFELIYPLVS